MYQLASSWLKRAEESIELSAATGSTNVVDELLTQMAPKFSYLVKLSTDPLKSLIGLDI